MSYEIKCDYQEDITLRASFNSLAKETFCLDFEPWYQKGYWNKRYSPHSIVEHGEVISNVSVNLMDFIYNGEKKRFIQLGTLMTKKERQGEGLGSMLMQAVLEKYKPVCDGIYLFANKNALDYYPRFGFTKATEFQASCTVSPVGGLCRVDLSDMSSRLKFCEAQEHSCANSMLYARNSEIFSFYLDEMNVFYSSAQKAYLVASFNKEEAFISQVISQNKVDLHALLNALPREISKVRLGFTPLDRAHFSFNAVENPDDTLYIMGKALSIIEQDKLLFPVFSHA